MTEVDPTGSARQLPRAAWALAGLAWLLVAGWYVAFALTGRPNDDGWYLYAAQRALAGELPYRDLRFPHPPLALAVHLPAAALASGPAVLAVARLAAAAANTAGIALAILALPARLWLSTFAAAGVLLALDPYALYGMTLVKSYPVATLALGAVLLALARGRPGLAGLALGLGAGGRPSLLVAIPALVRAGDRWQAAGGAALGLCLSLLPVLWLGPDAFASQLYMPLVGVPPLNEETRAYLGAEVAPGLSAWLGLAIASLLRTATTHLPLVVALLGAGRVAGAAGTFARDAVLAIGAVHLLALRPYDEYQLVLLPCVIHLVARTTLPRPDARVVLAAGLLAIPSFTRALNRLHLPCGVPLSAQLTTVGREIRRVVPSGGTLLTLDPLLAVAAERRLPRGLELGRFALNRPGVTSDVLERIRAGTDAALLFPERDPTGLDPVEEMTRAARERYVPIGRFERLGERQQDAVLWARIEAEAE